MDRHEDAEIDRDLDRGTDSSTVGDGESHATTGGAAAAGAVTGGVIGLTGGPIGAAIGAVGGAIVGAAAERMMHSDDDAERAREGFDHDHDHNPMIEDRAKEPGTGTMGTTTGTTDYTGATGTTGTTDYTGATGTRGTTGMNDTGDRMQLREEELHARTAPVETGQVTVAKDVVEERRTLDVPVTREEAYVERTPVERRPSDRPIDETSSRSIDVPLHEERVNLEKQPVVYEEVGVGKREVTDTQQVSGTVRREEARVEQDGDAKVRRTDTP